MNRFIVNGIRLKRGLNTVATEQVIYEGSFSQMLQILKKVSVFSCGCTLVSVPLLTAFGNENMHEMQRLAVGATVVIFALGTTGTLHYICKPYVSKIVCKTGSLKDPLRFETINFFGRKVEKELLFNISKNEANVRVSGDRLFSTFSIDGNFYYVHEERENWYDEKLFTELEEYLKVEREKETEELKRKTKIEDDDL
eukprot:snap_masked-scaffold_40-processed-gene-2.6-mRNA-1 protein AED:1.00 eAED:1.00 QI:0/-1/0/0/-1/1/1/0/196